MTSCDDIINTRIIGRLSSVLAVKVNTETSSTTKLETVLRTASSAPAGRDGQHDELCSTWFRLLGELPV